MLLLAAKMVLHVKRSVRGSFAVNCWARGEENEMIYYPWTALSVTHSDRGVAMTFGALAALSEVA